MLRGEFTLYRLTLGKEKSMKSKPTHLLYIVRGKKNPINAKTRTEIGFKISHTGRGNYFNTYKQKLAF